MKKPGLAATGLAAALLLGQPGCATIMHGSHQSVYVASDAPAASLDVDGNAVSPGHVRLRRGDDHVATATTPDARSSVKIESHVSWGYALIDSLIAVFTFPFGLAAPIIDVLNGAICNLEPEDVRIPAPGHEGTPGQAPPTHEAPPVREAPPY